MSKSLLLEWFAIQETKVETEIETEVETEV